MHVQEANQSKKNAIMCLMFSKVSDLLRVDRKYDEIKLTYVQQTAAKTPHEKWLKTLSNPPFHPNKKSQLIIYTILQILYIQSFSLQAKLCMK